jgi:DNA-directed RNA polymerase specialized sigma24 family protein
MGELSSQTAGPKKNWILNSQSFQRLLSWLDGDAQSEGQKYLEMRRRLVAYFDRKNCLMPDDLADETLNRVARRLEEEESIEVDAPARYCYIVARFVFMEYLRGAEKYHVPLDEWSQQQQTHSSLASTTEAEQEDEIKEQLLSCLEHCTGQLESPSRELIVQYYVGQERIKIENRRALAARLGITMNALSIRACRIRDRLEACVRECAS